MSTLKRQKNTASEKWLLTTMGVLFLLPGIIAIVLSVQQMMSGFIARQWPETKGYIVKSGVRWQHSTSRGTPTLIADVVYEYEVDGRIYRHDRISANQFGSNKSSHARLEAQSYPVNSAVVVHYNPDQPAQSFLKTGIGWIYLIGVAVGGAVSGVGIFLLKQGFLYLYLLKYLVLH